MAKIARKWTDERIEEEIRMIMVKAKCKYMPTSGQMTRSGHGAFIQVIDKAGGFEEWGEKLGIGRPKHDFSEVQRLREKGLTVQQIANSYAVEKHTIENYLARLKGGKNYIGKPLREKLEASKTKERELEDRKLIVKQIVEGIEIEKRLQLRQFDEDKKEEAKEFKKRYEFMFKENKKEIGLNQERLEYKPKFEDKIFRLNF